MPWASTGLFQGFLAGSVGVGGYFSPSSFCATRFSPSLPLPEGAPALHRGVYRLAAWVELRPDVAAVAAVEAAAPGHHGASASQGGKGARGRLNGLNVLELLLGASVEECAT